MMRREDADNQPLASQRSSIAQPQVGATFPFTSSFTPGRSQDAWFVIRGFIFQVETTIERWLHLSLDEVLELECGEDIDIDGISRLLPSVLGTVIPTNETSIGVDSERLLEQIKVQESLTLTSSRGLLANFAAHRAANPERKLRFRFTTSASITNENPKLLPSFSQPALAVWQDTAAGRLDETLTATAIEELQSALLNLSCPGKCAPEVWDNFQEWLQYANEKEFRLFVERVEWSVGTTAPQDMTESLHNQLQAKGWAENCGQAKAQHERLFLHVFKTLSRSGVKQLTRADLEVQLALPKLDEADRVMLEHVVRRLCDFETQLGVLEERVEVHTGQISALQSSLQDVSVNLIAAQGLNNLAFARQVAFPSLALPSETLVAHHSPRTLTVQGMASALSSARWTSIYGGIGWGKTHLAILTAQQMGTCRAWIRLRDCSQPEVCTRLDMAMVALQISSQPSMPPISSELSNWRILYRKAISLLPAKSVIVLDDLPALRSDGDFAERMCVLCALAREHDLHLLSTSTQSLPQGLREVLSADILEIPMPPLSGSEIEDVLRAFGIPERLLLKGYLDLVQAGTRGHPAMVTAYALDQRENNWRFNDAWFERLFPQDSSQDFAAPLRAESVERMLDTVRDPESRELLSRLSMVGGSFDLTEMQALAEVEPPIYRPAERLQSLKGLWVQSDGTSKYMVSPLVNHLGRDNLLSATRRACHGALGDIAVARGGLSQTDVLIIHSHYIKAEQWDRAGTILLWMLLELGKMDSSIPDYALSALYEEILLPTGMSLPVRASIRAAQINLRRKKNQSVARFLEHADVLISEAGPQDGWAVLPLLHASYMAASETGEMRRALSHILQAQRILPEFEALIEAVPLPEDIKKDIRRPRLAEGGAKEIFLWWPYMEMHHEDDVTAWIEMVESLTPAEREMMMTDPNAPEYSLLIANRLWLIEGDKTEEEQNWSHVERQLTELGNRAAAMGLEPLWACFQESRVVMLAEMMKDIAAAQLIVDEALAHPSSNPTVQFILHWSMGMQYAYIDDHQNATLWLLRALECETEHYFSRRVSGLLWAARSIGLGETSSAASEHALNQVHQAVELAEQQQMEGHESERLKGKGELAIAQWKSNGASAAFEPLSDAVESLMESKSEEIQWKTLFIGFSHLVSHLTFLLESESPPQVSSSGERIVTPERGYFLKDYTQSMQSHPPLGDLDYNWLAIKMALLADVVGQDKAALSWANRAIVWQPASHPHGRLPLLPIIVVTQLEAGDWRSAIAQALEAGRIRVSLFVDGISEGQQHPLNAIDVPSIFPSLPESLRREAEYFAVSQGLIPLVLWLAGLHLQNSDEARDVARDVTSFLREQSESAFFPELWRSCATAIEAVWVQPVSILGLFRASNNTPNDLVPWSGPEDAIPRLICCLGATLQADVSLPDALASHARVAPFFDQRGQFSHIVEQRLVAPFFWQYWEARFTRSRFLFSSPHLVEQEFERIHQLPTHHQPKALLRTLIYSLKLRFEGHVSDWLRSQD